ncbi:hypothetical protein FRB98_000192 [Tulasnella sp. 332]|nr:hypothetical protein FRB98_000192 [Tulasnella sp. 332]
MLAPLNSAGTSGSEPLSGQKRARRTGRLYQPSDASSRGMGDENIPLLHSEIERATYRVDDRQKATHSSDSVKHSNTGLRESTGQDRLPSSRSFLTITPKAKRFFETITTRSRSDTAAKPEDKIRLRSKSSATAGDDKNKLQKIFGSIGKSRAISVLPELLRPPSKDVPHPGRGLTKPTKTTKTRPPLKSLTPVFADSALRPNEDRHRLLQKVTKSPRRVPPPAFDSGDCPPPLPTAPDMLGSVNTQHVDPSTRPVICMAPDTVSLTVVHDTHSRPLSTGYYDTSVSDHYDVSIAIEGELPDVEDWSTSTYDGDPFGLEPRNCNWSPPPRQARTDIPSRPRSPLPPHLVESIKTETVLSVVAQPRVPETTTPVEQSAGGSYRTTSELRSPRSTFDHTPAADNDQHTICSNGGGDSSLHPPDLIITLPPPTTSANSDPVRFTLSLDDDPAAVQIGASEQEDVTEGDDIDGTPIEGAGHGTPLPSDLTVWWREEGEYYALTRGEELDELRRHISEDVGF